MRYTPPSREIDRVFLHCTATSRRDVTVADLRLWHVGQRGWSDIGYHYFIDSAGALHACRPTGKTPAAQRGHNAGTIAICLNGLVLDDFTEAQFSTLRALCAEIRAAHPDVTFHGHCEVSPKACPVFDYRAVLGLDEFGEMSITPAREPDDATLLEQIAARLRARG